MNPADLDALVKGLKVVLDEHGFERARLDAGWLNNILADYSPQTPALNRVVATVAREGFADLLKRATTVGESDAVVCQAVSGLVSVHAIEQGVAYDAVTAWATVLGVVHNRQRPSSVMSASSVLGVGDRLERKIQRLLDEAEAAEERGDWVEAVERYDEVLMLEPTHSVALQLRVLAELRKLKGARPKVVPKPVRSKSVPSKSKVAAATSYGDGARKAWMAASNSPKLVAKPVLLEKTTPQALSPKAPKAWTTNCRRDSFGLLAVVIIEGVEVKFRYCVPGQFLMGSKESESGRFDDEGPTREVKLTHGFWMAEVPVTQQLWKAVVGSNPSKFKGADLPVEQVSWSDCDGWIKRANSKCCGLNLRFPTEAEWEYAARAKTTWPRYGDLDAIAWHRGNSGAKTHEVKGKKANAWGLHDLIGNVWEWCLDWYGEYPAGCATDPKGPSSGTLRVCRGGGWGSGARSARSANRARGDSGSRNCDLGFRLAFSDGD